MGRVEFIKQRHETALNQVIVPDMVSLVVREDQVIWLLELRFQSPRLQPCNQPIGDWYSSGLPSSSQSNCGLGR
jgi:hypothetical protein